MYNPYLITALVFVSGILMVFFVFKRSEKKNNIIFTSLPPSLIEGVLLEKVKFYAVLTKEEKDRFKSRVVYFLRRVKISAEKGAVVSDEDKILIAASATIPLFHFETWAYENLDEVLVYPDYFDQRFDMEAEQRNISGMVGNGAMNHKMLLSLPGLRAGFDKYGDGNTAVHEFVHLIDKADGEIDGIPEYLIPKDLVEPWIKEMNRTIREIRTGESNLREYAATNDAEFLAVLSEYFFKRPKMLKEEHPRLYDFLDKIYNRIEK